MEATKTDGEARRADLVRQLGQARERKAKAEAELAEANRLIDVIDGALQENALWLSAIARANVAKASLKSLVEREG